MKGFEREVMDAGCSAYLTKPIDIDRLLDELADMLGGQRIASAQAQGDAARLPAGSADERPRPDNAAMALPASVPRHEEPDAPVVSRFATHPRFRPTVIKFGKRITEQLAVMERAWAARDGAELASFAHWLKGAGGTVGYDVFTEPAEHLEQCAKSGDFEEAAAVVDQLRGLVRRMAVPQDGAPEIAVP
jgi:HPt (histidine-containing phosphotransfer) domain-containing protein